MKVDLETQLRSYRRNFDKEAPAVDLLGRTDQPVVAPDTRGSVPNAWRTRRGLAVAIAAAVLVLIAIGGVGLISNPVANEPDPTGLPSNGWIAFADKGIWLVSLDQEPRRVIGTDPDFVDELCPAFSPDGRRLAYGQLVGMRVALAVVDVDADGQVSDPVIIEVGDGLPPPCPVWSRDGTQIAFGVARTSPGNPTTSAAGSEVWIVDLSDNGITVLPDLLATDVEWSPDGNVLAIVSGVDQIVPGNVLHDGRIYLYETVAGTLRSIDATLGATTLTWSPDGERIAYQSIAAQSDAIHVLRVIDVDTEKQEVLTGYGAIHGIGPVWSPDGGWILYLRCYQGCAGEGHEAVLVPANDPQDGADRPGEVVFQPLLEEGDGASACQLFPISVTWSPDGRYLLYDAWGGRASWETYVDAEEDPACSNEFFYAVPIDQEQAIVKLTGPEPGSGDRHDERTLTVPIQTWGIRPSD